MTKLTETTIKKTELEYNVADDGLLVVGKGAVVVDGVVEEGFDEFVFELILSVNHTISSRLI